MLILGKSKVCTGKIINKLRRYLPKLYSVHILIIKYLYCTFHGVIAKFLRALNFSFCNNSKHVFGFYFFVIKSYPSYDRHYSSIHKDRGAGAWWRENPPMNPPPPPILTNIQTDTKSIINIVHDLHLNIFEKIKMIFRLLRLWKISKFEFNSHLKAEILIF